MQSVSGKGELDCTVQIGAIGENGILFQSFQSFGRGVAESVITAADYCNRVISPAESIQKISAGGGF